VCTLHSHVCRHTLRALHNLMCVHYPPWGSRSMMLPRDLARLCVISSFRLHTDYSATTILYPSFFLFFPVLLCVAYFIVHYSWYYGVASASRIDEMIGLFCKRALQKRQYSANETNNSVDPTDRNHPIS